MLFTARLPAETLTYYAIPDIHWQKIRTTDEIDKSFLLDLLFLRSMGDRVAKSRARGCHLGRAANGFIILIIRRIAETHLFKK